MGTELVQRGTPQDPIRLGEVLATSGYFQDARDAAKCAVKVMAGQELGFGPIASMTGVHIIKGKPSVGANLLAALVKGSAKYRYEILDLTDERCEIEISERVDDSWRKLNPTSTFSMDDAKKANLSGDSWKHYPRNMLFARALSNAVTFHCPDLTSGAPIYTPEELGEEVDGSTGELIEAPAQDPALDFIDEEEAKRIQRRANRKGRTNAQIMARLNELGYSRWGEVRRGALPEVVAAIESAEPIRTGETDIPADTTGLEPSGDTDETIGGDE